MPMRISGVFEAQRELAKFPAKVGQNAARRAARRAGNVILEEVRLRAPHVTGALAASFGVTTGMIGTQVIATIKPRKRKHSFLARFFEYGTAPHWIARTGAGQGRVTLRNAARGDGAVNTKPMKIGADFVSGIVLHPGIRPKPFIRPAADIRRDDAVLEFATAIGDWLRQGMPVTRDVGETLEGVS